jgi:hypothetical protein
MIFIGSIVAVVLLSLVPAINAIQVQTVENELSKSYYSYDEITRMDANELVVFIQNLAKDYPELSKEFQRCINEMENAPVSSLVNEQLSDMPRYQKGIPHPLQDNQTFLEKIFWKIFNYRVFRLYLSTCIFLFHESKLTLMRTMTWGIKLLRLVKIGIILGIIDPTPEEPQTPVIQFVQDETANKLLVASASVDTVLWSDIDEIGSGSCDQLPVGNVTAGDEITNCTGIIVLRYIPTDTILGVFEFD